MMNYSTSRIHVQVVGEVFDEETHEFIPELIFICELIPSTGDEIRTRTERHENVVDTGIAAGEGIAAGAAEDGVRTWAERHENLVDTGIAAGAGIAAGVGVPVVATAGLTALGFGGSGIVAGSVAAGVQSSIGSVAAGSLFATMQSVGATGGVAILGPIGIGAAIVVGAGVGGFSLYRRVLNRGRH